MNIEQQLQTKELIYTTFSIISYLRDFFPESCYTTTQLCGISIKNLKPSSHSGAAKYIEWLEKGIYSAIDKKYLSVVIIGIYLKDPTKIVETYTFEINYNENNKKFGTESVSKMIKTLCLLVQSLQPLPNIKYVTVRLKYCDHVPINYNPPCFKAANNDKLEFVSEPLKLDIGCATIGKEKTILKLQTLFDYSNTQNNLECDIKDNDKSTNNVEAISTQTKDIFVQKNNQIIEKSENQQNSAVLKDITNKKDKSLCKDHSIQYDSNYNIVTGSEKNKIENINTVQDKKISVLNEEISKTNNTQATNEVKKEKQQNNKKGKNLKVRAEPDKTRKKLKKENTNDSKIYVRNCLCTANTDDGDMLQCDKCKAWMHTVCCGFFSNTDKRIPENEYICDFCKKEFSIEYLRKIAMYRRALSVIYNEGFANIDELSRRLDFSVKCIKRIVDKFVEEGFIVKDGNEYVVIKNSDTKAKIKMYFSLKVNSEKTSQPIEDIKCNY